MISRAFHVTRSDHHSRGANTREGYPQEGVSSRRSSKRLEATPPLTQMSPRRRKRGDRTPPVRATRARRDRNVCSLDALDELDTECDRVIRAFSKSVRDEGTICGQGVAHHFALPELAVQIRDLAEVRAFVDDQLATDLADRVRTCQRLVQLSLHGGSGDRCLEVASATARSDWRGRSAMTDRGPSVLPSQDVASRARALSPTLEFRSEPRALAPFRSKSQSVCRR